MPAKFRVKNYQSDGTYYIYSRADTGRNVFEDEVDYQYFLALMKRYCGGLLVAENSRYKPDRPYRLRKKKEMVLAGEVKILAFCLLREGVSMVVWQKNRDGITRMMRRIITAYTMYVNNRHHRKGKLFAGVYKGVRVSDGEKLVYLSRWVHRQPGSKTIRRFGLVESVMESRPEEYLYSSYRSFLEKERNQWLDTGVIVEAFEKMSAGRWKSYREFVEDEKIPEEGWLREMVE